ncbi:PFL_4669 family integrating conjugative element protein [Pseudomaricurvus hydrocarbonicus]|uniref:PFL_4669 family integrating conjugative element protein n=1 Tax=Pseudomaricurvus hydrocarbonicus TaxID=1470433 RepID=UPI001AA0921F|nr:TIGR03761 family integrating conjugative element protein [Aestuariicella hydrocarbonica]
MSSDTDIDFDAIPPSAHLARTGGLQGDVWLTLQTYQAQALIRGRRAEEGKPVIVGLLGFAERLRTLWQAARMDDPYADWWLLKVEEGIAGSRAQLCRLQQLLEALIASAEGLEVSIAHSERPQRVSLQFASPYAFRAAQLLADYDQVVCTAMTLRHVGMTIPDALLDQLKGSGRWVRRVLSGRGWGRCRLRSCRVTDCRPCGRRHFDGTGSRIATRWLMHRRNGHWPPTTVQAFPGYPGATGGGGVAAPLPLAERPADGVVAATVAGGVSERVSDWQAPSTLAAVEKTQSACKFLTVNTLRLGVKISFS